MAQNGLQRVAVVKDAQVLCAALLWCASKLGARVVVCYLQ